MKTLLWAWLDGPCPLPAPRPHPPQSLSDSGMLYEPRRLQPGTQKSLVRGTRPTPLGIPGSALYSVGAFSDRTGPGQVQGPGKWEN